MKKCIEQIKLETLGGSLSHLHVFSDGCGKQFKGRNTFQFMSTVFEEYGVNLQWNFFASCHGKGSWDGAGGLTKSALDKAINGQLTEFKILNAADCCEYLVCILCNTMLTIMPTTINISCLLCCCVLQNAEFVTMRDSLRSKTARFPEEKRVYFLVKPSEVERFPLSLMFIPGTMSLHCFKSVSEIPANNSSRFTIFLLL